MTKTPLVSIVMSAWNHASYVAQAIQSVLDQTFKDFEFLIADDGSSDATKAVIASFQDPRILFFPHENNRGACITSNELIEKAKGKYVAVLNSDDYWSSDKLMYQVDFLENNAEYSAIFSDVTWVDDKNNIIPKEDLGFGKIFEQRNRTQGEWLRFFFDFGNCLCHPSVLIHRSCYVDLGLYDNCYRQLPDFDMWVRLAKKYLFFVSDKNLVSFRQLPMGQNASSQTPENALRSMNEQYLIASDFFDGVSANILIEGFSDLLIFKNPPSNVHLDIEKCLLFFTENPQYYHLYQRIGLTKLFQLLHSPAHRFILEKDYQKSDFYFQKLSSMVSVFEVINKAKIEELQLLLLSSQKNVEELQLLLLFSQKNELNRTSTYHCLLEIKRRLWAKFKKRLS
jgi:glycosyltransferase involved in cell wall biosynthesis